MINELKQLEQEEICLKKEIKGLKKRTWIMILLTIGLLGIILSVFQMFVIAPIELSGQFELELQVLSPYLEKETLLDLQSDWVLMKSKDD